MAEKPTMRRRPRKPGGSSTRPFGSAGASKPPKVDDAVPSGFAHAFIAAKQHEKAVRQAGLEPPSDFQGDMPELPSDIDAVDHSELSNLMHAFQNALSTSVWQASMKYIESDIYEEIADYLKNRALLASEESNDTKRRADAETDEDYLRYRALHKEAYHNYVRFRDLARTIEGKVKVLSRTGGFKDDEHEASDRTARSKPSIGRRQRRSKD